MSTHAVVVNWNGGPANLACLRSLLDQGLPPSAVAFIDNGSTDGSLELVLAAFPTLGVQRNPSNTGFARASNQGVRHALECGADRLLLVNNDVLLAPGTLRTLEKALADPGLGIVAPRIAYARNPGTLWCAGGRIAFRQNVTELIGHKEPDGPRWQHTMPVDFVPGCAMLLRREVLERIGLFDEDFFAYHEDADLCLRARNAGFGVACVGCALAFHEPHSSTGGGYNPGRKYMMGVNSIWFMRRHGTGWDWASFLAHDALTWPFLLVLASLRGRTRPALAKGCGMWDGLRGRRVTAERLGRWLERIPDLPTSERVQCKSPAPSDGDRARAVEGQRS
jgi:hypothetical protein